MFEKFTDRARRVIIEAGNVARQERSVNLSTGHLLAGLLEEGESLAFQVLTSFEDKGHLMGTTRTVLQGWATDQPPGHPSWTTDGKKALEGAAFIAQQIGVSYVGPEHILLALLGRPEEDAPERDCHEVLTKLRIDPVSVQARMRERLEDIRIAEMPEAKGASAYDVVYLVLENLTGELTKLFDEARHSMTRDQRNHLLAEAEIFARRASHLANILKFETPT